MQEQVNEKTVALTVKAAKLTGRLLAQAMQAYIRKMREPPKVKPGRHSLRSLTKDGASLSNAELLDPNARQFDRIARKYNVRYHLKIDKAENPPKWIVYFKAKESDALMAAFKEYSKVTLKQKEQKPSLLEKLAKFKDRAKQFAAPVKHRSKGGHEL